MAESTLSMAYYELADEVSNFLGYQEGSVLLKTKESDLTQTQRAQRGTLHRVMKSGLRQFYFPPPMAGSDSPTDWSFLHPTTQIPFPVNSRGIQMPDDFGGLEGQITIAPSVTLIWWPLQLRNEGYIRAQYAQFPEMVSRPLCAALTPLKGTTATSGQRWELLIFPQADQDYTLLMQYYILPDYLSGAFPYAYGGAQHAETILESCLAIAEQKLDDMAGVHTAKFQERLMASVGMDRKTKAQNLGYNRDLSDNRWRGYAPWWHYGDPILVNGVLY